MDDQSIYPPGETPPHISSALTGSINLDAKPKKSILKSRREPTPATHVSGASARKSHVPFSHVLPELSRLEEEDAKLGSAGRAGADADLQSVSSAASLSPLSSGDEMAADASAKPSKTGPKSGRDGVEMWEARPGPPRRGGYNHRRGGPPPGPPPPNMMGYGPGIGHCDGLSPPRHMYPHPMDDPEHRLPMEPLPLLEHRTRVDPFSGMLMRRTPSPVSPGHRLVRYTPSPERRLSRSPLRGGSRSPPPPRRGGSRSPPPRRGSRSPRRWRSRSRSPRRRRSRSWSRYSGGRRHTRSPSLRRRSRRTRSRTRSRSPVYLRSFSGDPGRLTPQVSLGTPQPVAGFPTPVPAPVPSPFNPTMRGGVPMPVPMPGAAPGFTLFPAAGQPAYPQPVPAPRFGARPVPVPSPAPTLLSIPTKPPDGITERLDSATFLMEVAKRREQKIMQAKLGTAAVPTAAPTTVVSAATTTAAPAGAGSTAPAEGEKVPQKFFSQMTPDELAKKAQSDLVEVLKVKPWYTMELVMMKMQMDEHRLTKGIKNKEFRVMAKQWNSLVTEAKKKNDMKTALSGEATEGAVERLARRLDMAVAQRNTLAGELLQLKADQKKYGDADLVWKKKEGGPSKNKKLHVNLKKQGEIITELDKATELVSKLNSLLYPSDKFEMRDALRGSAAQLLQTAEEEAELDAATKAGEVVHFLVLGDRIVESLEKYIQEPESRASFGTDLPPSAIQLRWRADASLHSLQMRHWIRSQVNHTEPHTLLLMVSARCLEGDHWFPAMAISPLFSLLRDLREAGLERAIIVGVPPQRNAAADERVSRLNRELQERFIEPSPKMPVIDYLPFMAGPLDGFGKRTPEGNTQDVYKTVARAIAKCRQQSYTSEPPSAPAVPEVSNSDEAAGILKQLRDSLMGRLAGEEAVRLIAVMEHLKKAPEQIEEEEEPDKEERKITERKPEPEPEPEAGEEVNPDAEDPAVFFRDPADHICLICSKIFLNAKSYLDHIKTDEHLVKYASGQPEAPWRKAIPSVEKKHKNARPKPIKGLDMFIRVDCFYCKVCDMFVGDLRCASSHLKSRRHNANYEDYLENNPAYHAVISENRSRLLLQIAMAEQERTRKRRREEQERWANTQNEKLRRASESVQDVSDAMETSVKDPTTPPAAKKAGGGIKLNLINPPPEPKKADMEVEELKKKVAANIAEEKARAEAAEARALQEMEKVAVKKEPVPAPEKPPVAGSAIEQIKPEDLAKVKLTLPGKPKPPALLLAQRKAQPMIGKLPHLREKKKASEPATVESAQPAPAPAAAPAEPRLTLEEKAKLEYAVQEGLLTEQERVTLQLAMLQEQQMEVDDDAEAEEPEPAPPGVGPGPPGMVSSLPPTKPGAAPPMSHTPPPAPRAPPPRVTRSAAARPTPPAQTRPPAPPPSVPQSPVPQPPPPGLSQSVSPAQTRPPPMPHAPPPAPRAPPPTTSSPAPTQPAAISKPAGAPPLSHAPPPAPKAPPPTAASSPTKPAASVPTSKPTPVSKQPATQTTKPTSAAPTVKPASTTTTKPTHTTKLTSTPTTNPTPSSQSAAAPTTRSTTTKSPVISTPKPTPTTKPAAPTATKSTPVAKPVASSATTPTPATKSAASSTIKPTSQAKPTGTPTTKSALPTKPTASPTMKQTPASKPTPAAGTKSTPAAVTKPTPAAGTKPTPAAGTKPTPAAGTKPTPAAGTKPTPAAGTKPTPAAGTKPTPAAGTKPTPATGTKPTPAVGIKPPPAAGTKPTAAAGTKPTPTAGTKPPLAKSAAPSTKPSTPAKSNPPSKTTTPAKSTPTPTKTTAASKSTPTPIKTAASKSNPTPTKTTAASRSTPAIKTAASKLTPTTTKTIAASKSTLPLSKPPALAKPAQSTKSTAVSKSAPPTTKPLTPSKSTPSSNPTSKPPAKQTPPKATPTPPTKAAPVSLLPPGTEAVSDDDDDVDEDEIAVMDEDLLEFDLPDAGEDVEMLGIGCGDVAAMPATRPPQ